MTNKDTFDNELAKYRNKDRRNILIDTNFKINGIDYIEVYSLSSLISAFNNASRKEDNNYIDDNVFKNLNSQYRHLDILEKNDQAIIIAYCFKPIDSHIDKNNILIEGSSSNNSNIIVSSTITGLDFLKEQNNKKKQSWTF